MSLGGRSGIGRGAGRKCLLCGCCMLLHFWADRTEGAHPRALPGFPSRRHTLGSGCVGLRGLLRGEQGCWAPMCQGSAVSALAVSPFLLRRLGKGKNSKEQQQNTLLASCAQPQTSWRPAPQHPNTGGLSGTIWRAWQLESMGEAGAAPGALLLFLAFPLGSTLPSLREIPR